MPDIAATFRSLLVANINVSNLVGTRVYSDQLVQGASMPAITYFVVDTLPNEHLTGIADVSRARIQVDCYADTRGGANDLADKVRLAMEKQHRGDNSGQFINEISLATGEVHSVDRPEAGSDKRRYITAQDFFVHYRTTTS